jgi:hypothetical protein
MKARARRVDDVIASLRSSVSGAAVDGGCRNHLVKRNCAAVRAPSMAAMALDGAADRGRIGHFGASGPGKAVKVRKHGGMVCLSRHLSSDEYSNVVS